MSNYPAGAEHDPNAPYNEEETYTCSVCDKEMSTDSGVCSQKCFEIDMM